MERHADFSIPVLLHAPAIPWLPSPMPGVHRRMLDRIGDEVARATTIVRYAPGSAFSAHTHGGGEEFIVLDGTFQDEHGEYPAGTYVRNPPTSSHTPGSAPGCTLFVKLWQFDPSDRRQMRLRMEDLQRMPIPGTSGIEAAVIVDDQAERVSYQAWEAGASMHLELPGGAEILVLEGSLETSAGALQTQSWLRLPPGATFAATAGTQGARLWMKTDHLLTVSAPVPSP